MAAKYVSGLEETNPAVVEHQKGQFKTLAEDLKPSPEFIKQGNIATNKVFDLLRGSSELSIARVVIAGSVGKKTALHESFYPDYDLVVILNDQTPKMSNKTILEEFQRVLMDSKAHLNGFRFGRLTRHSIQFSLLVNNQTIEFDLLPSINFVLNAAGGSPSEIQAALALEEMKKNPEKSIYQLSSSLAEETVSFVKGFPEWMKSIILVSKLWDKMIKDDKGKGLDFCHISGRSYLIELVAIKANQDLDESKDKSVFAGFQRFLILMTRLVEINVIFLDKYKLQDIPAAISNQRPLIMDPINPMNNLAEGLKLNVTQAYQEYAATTLKRLKSQGSSLNLNLNNFNTLLA